MTQPIPKKLAEKRDELAKEYYQTNHTECAYEDGFNAAAEIYQEHTQKLVEALEEYSSYDKYCLYDDIDWTYNWIGERDYKHNRVLKAGTLAQEALKAYREAIGDEK